ncbi:MAG: hypothetical protein KKD38_01345 [Candidatus Delongbacteria bacterium]|nr:hypothetical protein [Candidatus Delongbacteria bacterium]
MLKNFLLLLIIFSDMIFSYPFTIPYFNEEFFLYPFLNYDQSFEWKRVREGKLYNGSSAQLSYGSLTTYDLMNNGEVVVNQEIGENFSFQSVYAYFGVNFNDILFDLKNLGEGKNNTMPLTLSSDIRFSFSRLYFFISGNYSTGIDRTWNPNFYTDILAHKNHIRNLYARIEYDLTDYLKIYSENYWDDFYDEKEYKDTLLSIAEYKFTVVLSENKLGGVWSLNNSNILDLGLGIANTAHDFDVIKGTAKSYDVDYSAILLWLLYNYKIGNKYTIQGGYMASYTTGKEENPYNKSYPDNELLKLGFEYRFSPNASLYISGGQLTNTGKFGGGNARFNLFF